VEQPGVSVATTAAAALNASARRVAARRLPSLGVPGNVQHNLEFQE
jgi:hypothetical protein